MGKGGESGMEKNGYRFREKNTCRNEPALFCEVPM